MTMALMGCCLWELAYSLMNATMFAAKIFGWTSDKTITCNVPAIQSYNRNSTIFMTVIRYNSFQSAFAAFGGYSWPPTTTFG